MKRKAKQEAKHKKQHDKQSRAQQQQQRNTDRQQRRQLLPILLAHEQEEEQRLLQAIQHKWKRMEEKYSSGDGGVKPLVRRIILSGSGSGSGSGSEVGGGYSGGGMYSPSSPFYFTHFSSYAHHASRIGPRYQSDIQPLLTPQQLNSAAEASRFPEHITPLSSPAAFNTSAASIDYNQRHFSSPPSFPAFSHVLSALISPQLLAYRREQWAIRERVKEDKKFGSVRVGGRGRRSTRITPGIGAGGAAEGGAEKRKREQKREERGVDSVPVVWERMLNDVGESMGDGGRERIKQLIDNIGQWRRQHRVERQTTTHSAAAPSSLSALPPPTKRTTPSPVADKSERTEGVDKGREGVGGGSISGLIRGPQQSVSSLATLPLTKDKDEKAVASKRKVEFSSESDNRRKRSRMLNTARQSQDEK